jgi:DNA-directed RNA polymerase specialized sigma24 family protein
METPREAVERAFLTAHLLTASIPVAEDITLRAIDSWNPREESQELLLENVVTAALRARVRGAADTGRSDRLNAVLLLSPRLRRCFVLRFLVGWSTDACARMLRTSRKRVDDNTCLALQHLPANFKPEIIAA